MMKKVRQLLPADVIDMGGIPVRQALPTARIEQVDPFLLLHHHISQIEPGSNPRDTGVGPHPHRGFSPVTFIFQGNIHHRDSRGNNSVVKAGGVQWMDAGMGIIHSERTNSELANEGGTLEIIQIWINTPGQNKMDPPRYIAAQKSDFPMLKAHSGQGYSQLVSGSQENLNGIIPTRNKMLSIMSYFKAGDKHQFEVPSNYHTILYVLDGAIKIEGFGLVEEYHLVVFEPEHEYFSLDVLEDSRLLILSAPPIGEPLATHGPFVMNNQTQILEAMRDYQMGKMGILIEEF